VVSQTPSVGRCLSDDVAVAYIEGALDDAGREQADRHMDQCSPCRWLVSALARRSTLDLSATELAAPAGRSAPEVLAAGTRIDRYEIVRCIGTGGMGTVYAARDPELERDVALKVMTSRRPASRDAQARMLREAQAMAKLSHPSVVPIYDVGPVGDGVFLAMKLVDGADARQWLATVKPSWQHALRVLSGAGRGLAAAHASGIVHRDVKPANILIGADDHAWVTDFGLARTSRSSDAGGLDGDAPPDAAPRAGPGAAPRATPGATADAVTTAVARPGRAVPHEPALTHPGTILGTPLYMSPEQHLARPADARSDQFSFCVLLYEAVYGERPFAGSGETRAGCEALAGEVVAGRVQRAPVGSSVPAWLRRMLLRGLAVDSAARWPSIDALLDAIERRQRRPRVIALASAAVLTLGLAFVIGAQAPGADDDSCRAAGPAVLEMISDRVLALAAVVDRGDYGRSLAPRLDRQLSEHAVRWSAGYRAACRAHREGQSADLVDRRLACLQRDRAALAAVTDVLRTADAASLPDAEVAASTLPDPAACGDIMALIAKVPRPPPALAERADALAAKVERARVLDLAGRYPDARALATSAVAGARELGYPPLLAEALATQARAMLDARDPAAIAVFSEAIDLALTVGDDALAVEAWARRAYIAVVTRDVASTAELDGRTIIEGLAKRASVSAFARALLYNNLGAIADTRQQRTEARRLVARARAEAQGVVGPGALELINVRINYVVLDSDPALVGERLAEPERELASLLGADHPQTISLRIRRGWWTTDLARTVAILTPACEHYERIAGGATAGVCWTEVGFARDELGDRAGAIAAMEHAQRTSGTAEARAYLALWRGDLAGAAAPLEAALAASAPDPSETAWAKLARGQLALALGRVQRVAGSPAALATLGRAIADIDAATEGSPLGRVLRRRARAHAEHARLLTGEAAATEARIAADLLRSEGGRPDEISELDRLARP
jgi:serine/threonine protein kinase